MASPSQSRPIAPWIAAPGAMPALLLTVVFGLFLYPSEPASARRRAFDFRHYCGLRTDRPFRVRVSRAGNIGGGRVLVLNRRKLDFQFGVRGAGRDIKGRVRLTYLRRRGSRVLLRLVYNGSRDGRKESSREIVSADAFLAENGILTFKYLRGKRFLQMGRARDGTSKITTDWGTASLLQ